MNRQKKMQQDIWLQLFLFILDVIAIIISFRIAYWLRFETMLIPVTKGPPNVYDYVRSLIFTLIIWEILFIHNRLYVIRGKEFGYNAVYRIVRSVITGTLIMMSLVFIFRNLNLSRWVVCFGLVNSIVILIFSRWLFSLLVMVLRRSGWGVSKTVIIGTGKMASMLAERISSHPECGYSFSGFIHTQTSPEEIPKDIVVLGNIFEMDMIISQNKIDKIIVACPELDRNIVFELLIQIEKNIVDFAIAPNMLEMMINRVSVDDMYGIPLLSLKESPLRGWKYVIKYSLDRFVSLGALIVLSPLFLIIAILIKLDSPGPVFYRQKRIGADGRNFTIYKFRSMNHEVEKTTGPVWPCSEDPRATRVGQWLRRYYFDEFPQLWNVFLGDMSLVGPRPERPFFVHQFKEKIPLYMSRHKVKSGITGWAQVNGLRGDTSIEERTKFDLYYIENWTFLFDLKILIMTFINKSKFSKLKYS